MLLDSSPSKTYHSLVKLLKILIRRTKSCQHLKILNKHCIHLMDQQATRNSSSLFEGNEERKSVLGESDVPSTEIRKTLGLGNSRFETSKPCSKSQVVSFVWAVCRSIVPADLLGTPFNWRVLRRNISKFLRLRRFEKFSLKQCMHKLKASKFPFLSNRHSSCYLSDRMLQDGSEKSGKVYEECSQLHSAMYSVQHQLLTNWIFWFFSCLVVPIVQANFYVTETECGKQNVYYYRKSVWERLTNRAITGLEDKNYCFLDDSTVRSIISERSFGFSKLRLRPKECGVRLLANLKASSRMVARESTCLRVQKVFSSHQRGVKFEYFKPVNSALRDTHAVLKGLLLKEPDKLGSSVFDYNGVYTKLCQFLTSLRHEPGTVPDVFIVVSDVSKAFDSIDQDKLLSIVNDVLQESKYIVERFYQVSHTKKSLWVDENLILANQNISNCNSRLSSSTLRSLHGILVNLGQSKCLRKEELLLNLNEHVKRNLVQLDGKFYLQQVGIPQGSVLSSLLCSLYYGHLERFIIHPYLQNTGQLIIEHPSETHKSSQTSSPRCMLLRFIDDFLFISTSMKQAATFFGRLQQGFHEYNCYMNEEKFSMNFDIKQRLGVPLNRSYTGQDGVSFLPWSGLLINCSTLEIQGDYTRYLDNHLSSTLTVCWQGKPSHNLKKRLCGFVRPKCHPIFFDSRINSAAVIRLNIYQVLLLCAMKFHCYMSDLWYICKLSPRSYLQIIEKSLRYMWLLIKKRMNYAHHDSDRCPILELEEGEVEWLGLNAFVLVLKKKQSRHKDLISLLISKLFAHKITASVSYELKYAVDRSHSSTLWKIKY